MTKLPTTRSRYDHPYRHNNFAASVLNEAWTYATDGREDTLEVLAQEVDNLRTFLYKMNQAD